MIKKLKRNIYQPEPWQKREILFQTGQWVKIIPADNLPDKEIKQFWIDEFDPRQKDVKYENPYGFLIDENDFEPIIKTCVFD